MKIVVIGSTGVIGSAVAKALAGKHEVIGVHRKSDPPVDLEKPATIAALFEKVRDVDAVVSCAGNAVFKPLAELADEDYEFCLHSKLLGQAAVIRHALKHLRDGGSVTVTSGVLAQHAMVGAAAISMVNCGVEGFTRGAALEAPRGIRVNVVSPGWVTETLVAMKMDPSHGMPAAEVARAYVASVEGKLTGQTIDPTKL
jgi:NAD(P)-dependent dehydrogenase (short-subunit alcohol dehydrogenase family)